GLGPLDRRGPDEVLPEAPALQVLAVRLLQPLERLGGGRAIRALQVVQASQAPRQAAKPPEAIAGGPRPIDRTPARLAVPTGVAFPTTGASVRALRVLMVAGGLRRSDRILARLAVPIGLVLLIVLPIEFPLRVLQVVDQGLDLTSDLRLLLPATDPRLARLIARSILLGPHQAR